MKLFVLGDSHARAMRAAALESPELVSSGSRDVRVECIIAAPRALDDFFSINGEEISLPSPPATKGLRSALGRESILGSDRAHRFVFAMGYTMTILLREQTWARFSPWRCASQSDGRVGLSDAAISAIALNHQKHVLAFYRAMKRCGHKLAVFEAPPPRADDQTIGVTITAPILIEVNRIAREAIDAALHGMGIPLIRLPESIYEGEPRQSFMKSSFHDAYGPRDTVHSNRACGELMLRRVLDKAGALFDASDQE